MNENVYKKLEFDTVLAAVAAYAQTDEAKEKISSLRICGSEYEMENSFELTEQALLILSFRGELALENYQAVSDFVMHAAKGGVLRNVPLKAIASACRTASQARRFICSDVGVADGYEQLKELAEELTPLKELAADIDAAIISDTEMSDNASAGLASVRRRKRSAEASLKAKLASIVSGDTKKYLQDNIVTIRSGRYVVPVRSEYRANINGIVHDTSASGLTLFVEPAAVVKLNNELSELEAEEQREMELILTELSAKVAAEKTYIVHNETVIFMLDEVFAKAAYASENRNSRPQISAEKKIILKKARHPLIDKNKAVASDITVGGEFTQVVITGPNTGGKTVALKTLGLAELMGQCGLFVPADSGSYIHRFDEIFADIGDEQSIAQSLSTFSAHMTNIVSILGRAGDNCLILLDELGAGTDPAEGAALAKAILISVKAKGALCAATTHYNEIKQYALYEPGAVNASVEFDTVNLRPTYKLNIGVPGRSNAFEISRRLGLSEDIISAAAADMNSADSRFDDIIQNLNEKLRIAAAEAEKAERTSAEAERLRSETAEENEKLRRMKDKFNTQAALEAKSIINEAKKEAKEIISQAGLDSANRASAGEHIEHLARKSLEKANSYIPQNDLLSSAGSDKHRHEYKRNEEVYVRDINAFGVIVELENKFALVQVGAIKTKIALDRLEPSQTKKEKAFSYTGMKAREASSSLDIRGITASEVSLEVEKFLDDASLAGLKCVTVIHGKGQGVLREEVTSVLKNHPLVDKFRSGGIAEGGSGATVVYLN